MMHPATSQDVTPKTENGAFAKVTAMVPCYNSAPFLQRTLASLDAQTWPNLEILIGEDCSTDNTLEIVKTFAEGRDNVRILKRSENLGWLKNANDLMANAAGEFLFFAFHDDVVDSSYVERLVSALLENPQSIIAYSDVEVFEVGGESEICSFTLMPLNSNSFERGYAMAWEPTGWWVPNRGIFKASAFSQIGGIRPNDQGEYSADWTWLLHMALIGDFVRVPEVLCRKYYQKSSLSKNWGHNQAQRLALRKAGVREVMMSHMSAIPKAILASIILIRYIFAKWPWIGALIRSVLKR